MKVGFDIHEISEFEPIDNHINRTAKIQTCNTFFVRGIGISSLTPNGSFSFVMKIIKDKNL